MYLYPYSFAVMTGCFLPATMSLVGLSIALIMAFLRNGCQQMGWPNYIQEIIIGVIIVLAVALDRARASWAERSAELLVPAH